MPKIAWTSGPVGYAQLGVAEAFSSELMDRTDVLSTPEAQAWIDEFFRHLSAVMPDSSARAQLATLRGYLVVDDAFVRAQNQMLLEQGMAPLLKRLPAAGKFPFGVGLLCEQIYYNASTLQDPAYDVSFRQGLAKVDALDSAVSGLRAQRMALARMSPSDWTQIATASEKMVAEIISAH